MGLKINERRKKNTNCFLSSTVLTTKQPMYLCNVISGYITGHPLATNVLHLLSTLLNYQSTPI